MELSVTLDSSEPWCLPFSAPELALALETMSDAMRPAPGWRKPNALELSVLDDAGMAALNLSFLGLPGPTNVLSFPATGEAAPTASLALAVQTVLREAWLYGQNPDSYVLKMLAHGLAHIMGFKHGREMDIEVERAAAEASALLTNNGSVQCLKR